MILDYLDIGTNKLLTHRLECCILKENIFIGMKWNV